MSSAARDLLRGRLPVMAAFLSLNANVGGGGEGRGVSYCHCILVSRPLRAVIFLERGSREGENLEKLSKLFNVQIFELLSVRCVINWCIIKECIIFGN